ncbi:Cof protein [Candidatus Koribacter versatilis Ellin345]|uniref:Cof protein n=1 Tax=Koribacter versatilis (strain Ellin345) TaxID=204669 RepID=Q1IMT6_KORVE|nr:Cof-type HAD-IIB family hydrolase [Candidatus Koribacter versatilis]ABF41814.1 Cof protein [Candidatus Koribacter versatilis Ellin345]
MSDAPIKLLVSDVDGTLLDPKKQLTEPVRQAVLRVKQAGLKFTIVSARPPLGTTFLIDALDITEPIACFNGALTCTPQYEILHQILLAADVATQVAQTILEHGLDLWMFRGAEWWVSKLNGPHTEGHIKLMRHEPRYLGEDVTLCARANKLVGVSDDHEAVKRCEKDVIAKCGDRVSATRSSDYYLDVTDHDANKGNAVVQLAKLMDIPLENVATIGDMPTDMFMFAKSGMSIAMGNASDEVKAAATFTTTSNAEGGYVKAMDEIVLPRVAQRAGAQG